jgi:uncharacterized protein (DUF3084 family)
MNRTKGIITIIVLILVTLSFLLLGRDLFLKKKSEGKEKADIERQIKNLRDEKKKIEDDLDANKALHAKLEIELNDVRRQIKVSEDDAAILKETKVELSAKLKEIDKALEEVSLSIDDINRRKAELINISQKLSEEKNVIGGTLTQVSVAKEGLENKIKNIMNQGVRLKPVIVEAQSQAQVIAVNTEFGFVVTDLGGPDLKTGKLISIYRDSTLIAQAKINKIRDSLSTAVVLPEWKGVEIKAGDSVTFAD